MPLDKYSSTMKRPAEETDDRAHSNKKHKHDHSHRRHDDDRSSRKYDNPPHREHKSTGRSHERHSNGKHSNDHSNPAKPSASHYGSALSQLPPPTSTSAAVPAYIPFTLSPGLPALPAVKAGNLSRAPFTHKSTTHYDRTSSSSDISYERLEFLGDAYIELISSRLIFERFPNLPAGQQSQLRELLVKNETLAEYSRAYGFDKRVEELNPGSLSEMVDEVQAKGKVKGNKGFNKVVGDVFEAYVAAVILSDVEDGFSVAEKWLTSLWAPKLLEATKVNKITHSSNDVDPSKVYNPAAKAELQKRIMGSKTTRLFYEPYKDTVELKGDQLGQNRHYIAVYLSGYGYERHLLGKGEGRNKVEAGNWAAVEAMSGSGKEIVEECERKLEAEREEKRAKREREEAEKAGAGTETGKEDGKSVME